MPDPATWLAFDFGEKRIGVAVGNQMLGTATPLAVVANRNGTPDWADIDDMVAEWQPAGLVVGIPLTLAGESQAITGHARGFLKRLKKRTGLPAFEADERHTSMNAQRELAILRQRGQRGRTQKSDVDTLAAALILEYWFAERARASD